MKKTVKLVKIIGTVVTILVVLLIVAWIWIDTIVATGIEEGGSMALGVETSVNDVSVSILGASFSMDQLTIANPEGYTTPHLMQTGKFYTNLQGDTVFTDEVVIPLIELDGLDMNIEQSALTNNVSTVLDNVKKRFPSKEQEEEPEEGTRSVLIKKVLIKNVTVHVKVGPGPQAPITIAEMELTDISSKGPKPQLVAKVTAELITGILKAVIEQAPGLPGELASAIRDDLGSVMKTIKADKVVEGAGSAVKGVLDRLPGLKKDEEAAPEE